MTQDSTIKVSGLVVVHSIHDPGGDITTPFTGEELLELTRSGAAVEVYRGPNLITDLGRSMLSRCMTFPDATSGVVIGSPAGITITEFDNALMTTMKVGDDIGASSPQVTDTDIYDNPAYATLTVTRTASTSLIDRATVSATIPTTHPATTIYEEGIFFQPDGTAASEVLFARVLFSTPIPKAASTALQVDHSIDFN
jgi:hypothetical protein